jgi:hypothetical protein
MGETRPQAQASWRSSRRKGASRASYALKLLQSEGELTIASDGEGPKTGKLVTREYRVEGPVMLFLTTTAIELDEELLNRCLVLTVDEEREQTRAIHRLQRQRRRSPAWWRGGSGKPSCRCIATRSGCCGRLSSNPFAPS